MASEKEIDDQVAAAAGALAGAIATAYAGPGAGAVAAEVVTAIASALLGGDDTKYQQEILNRLNVIERKLDEIIRFLNERLPDMLTAAVNQEEAKTILYRMHGDAIVVQNAMGIYAENKNPTEADAERCLTAANAVLTNGYALLRRSESLYLAALPFFASAFAALSVARKFDSKYAISLVNWAASYRNQLFTAVSVGLPGKASMRDVLSAFRRDLEEATAYMQDLKKPGDSVVYIVGVAEAGPTCYPYGARFTLREDWSVSPEYLRTVGPVLGVPAVRQDGDLAPLAAATGVAVHPLIRPAFGPAQGLRNAKEYWDYYSNNFVKRLDVSAHLVNTLPAKIKALDYAVQVLLPFVDGLQLLASIPHVVEVWPLNRESPQ